MKRNNKIVDNKVDVFFKMVCVGDSGTGKSHFLQTIHHRLNSRRKMKPLLSSISETIGIGFCSKIFLIREKKVKIHFWELSGQKRFSDIIETYFMNGNAILYFCSAEHPETIEAIGEWKDKIVTYKMGYSEFLNCRNSKNVLEQNNIADVSLDVPEMIILNVKDNNKKAKQNIEKYTSILNNYQIPVIVYNGSLHSTYDVCDTIISILLDYYENNDENEEYIEVESNKEDTDCFTEYKQRHTYPYLNTSDSDISKPLLKHSFSVDSISSITSSNEYSYPSHHRLTVVDDNIQDIIYTENDQECSRCWFFNWCNLF
jgi:GTPase SAR1 family protein